MRVHAPGLSYARLFRDDGHAMDHPFDIKESVSRVSRRALPAYCLCRMTDQIRARDQVASVVGVIASDETSFVTGAEICVDGGPGARFAS